MNPQPGRVLVLGSLNMDLVATASRHPQIGETVMGTTLNYYPGGKGLNQAVAAARDAAGQTQIAMLGAVGNDSFGEQLRQLTIDEGISQDWLATKANTPSGVALITVAEADNTIVVVPGANGALAPDDFASLEFSPTDILLGQFEIPRATTTAVFAQAHAAGATTILNPAPAAVIEPGLLDCLDYLVVNDLELQQQQATLPATILADSLKAIIHTRGSRGVAVTTADAEFELPAHEVPVSDTTGAGDCFCGVLAASLSRQESLPEAVTRANAAAALCVQSPGATPSIPTAAATSQFLVSL